MRCLDAAQEIAVRRHHERGEVLAPGCEENMARHFSQSRWHLGDRAHMVPSCPRRRLPGRSRQTQQLYGAKLRGFDGMAAHLRGERMGCVDDRIDPVGPEIICQPRNAAEPANARFGGTGSAEFVTPASEKMI